MNGFGRLIAAAPAHPVNAAGAAHMRMRQAQNAGKVVAAEDWMAGADCAIEEIKAMDSWASRKAKSATYARIVNASRGEQRAILNSLMAQAGFSAV